MPVSGGAGCQISCESSPMDRSAYEGANAAAAAPMLKAFVAGLFYLRIGRGEVVCVPWPSLWIVGSRRRTGTCVPDR